MADTVRLGLIGVGRWGQVYVRTIVALGDRCRLTHLGTSKPQNASLVPYPVHVEADWHRVVESECDAVIIATPASTHAEIVEACVDAGKPCIVEKPFCLDVATAERLQARIRATNALVLVDHTQLFNPAYQALRRRVRQTRESIRTILAERVGTEALRTQTPVVWEWAPHDVSLCVDLLAQRPYHVEVLCGPRGSADSPALVMVRLDFPGGICAWIQTGWLAAQKRRLFSLVTDRCLYVFDDLAREKLSESALKANGGKTDLPVWPVHRPLPVADARPSMVAMVTYFLDGLAGGDRGYFGSALALDVVRVLAACDAALAPVVRGLA